MIVLIIVLLIFAPYVLICWFYPALYWLLFMAEKLLMWLGRTFFGWALGSWTQQEHKTTAVLLGGNSILLCLLLLCTLVAGRLVVSYCHKKRRLRTNVRQALRHEPKQVTT